jgi:excisionase family DNA binding protein
VTSPYLTTGEAAAYTRCGRNAVYKAAALGELASIQRAPGGPRLYTLDDLDAWLRLGQFVTTPHRRGVVTRSDY